MTVPSPYYEIVAGGTTYLLSVQAVVGNIDRREAEMLSEEPDRPVGWLTISYRRVPIFSLRNSLSGRDRDRDRDWTRALVIQVDGGEPIGLAVEAVRAADASAGIPVEVSVPGNRFPGGCLFTQALIEGDRLRLICDPGRLSAHLHRQPRI